MEATEINQLIVNRLHQLESKENVKVLFALESGSRAWGMESRDSDYDIRFVYCYQNEEYNRLFGKIKDTINLEKEIIINPEGVEVPLDGVGWDLRKFLKLFAKYNPTSIEWSISKNYYINHPVTQELEKLATKFERFTLIKHYCSLSSSNFKRFIRSKSQLSGKKYLYVLRGLFNALFIYVENKLPTMDFFRITRELYELTEEKIPTDLKDILPLKVEIFEIINKLIERKRQSFEMNSISPINSLDELIERGLNVFQEMDIAMRFSEVSDQGINNNDLEELFSTLTKNLA